MFIFLTKQLHAQEIIMNVCKDLVAKIYIGGNFL